MLVCTKRIWVHHKWGAYSTVLLVSEHVIWFFFSFEKGQHIWSQNREGTLDYFELLGHTWLKKSKIKDKWESLNVSTVLKILSSVSWWWSELNWKQPTAARTDSLENFILKPYLCLNMYFVLKRTLYWYETSLYGNVISIPCSFRASKCKRRVSCVSHVSNPLPWFQRWPNAILNFWWLCWIEEFSWVLRI